MELFYIESINLLNVNSKSFLSFLQMCAESNLIKLCLSSAKTFIVVRLVMNIFVKVSLFPA